MMMRFTSHTIMTNAQLISQLRTELYDKTISADFIYQYVSSLAKGLMICSSLLERNSKDDQCDNLSIFEL